MITEDEYKSKIREFHGDSIIVFSKFRGLDKPILVKSKYGILRYSKANQLFRCKPNIKSALNKTEYFMNMLNDKYPNIYNLIHPESEYINMKTKMLFSTKFGIVSIPPDSLYSGHIPTIRAAVNRKEYFKNMLLYLYDNKYDFIVNSTDRHKGRVILICPIHGEVSVDNDHIFNGCGCPICNKGWTKSNVLYVIKLILNNFECYKLGISYKTDKGYIRRFKDYKSLGYKIEVITIKEFNSYEECHEKELELKQLIKNNLVTLPIWANKTSNECFSDSLLDTILNNLYKI